MPNWVVADDSSSYIAYSGSWVRQTGSSRQWESAVHSTSQSGASATFRFRGTGIKVYGTIPSGSGVIRSQYIVDGGSPTTVERQAGANPAYNEVLLDLSSLAAVDHSVTITNLGGGADFQLDRLSFLPTSDPASETPLPPASSNTGAGTAPSGDTAGSGTTGGGSNTSNSGSSADGNSGSSKSDTGRVSTSTISRMAPGESQVTTIVDSKGITSTATIIGGTNGESSTVLVKVSSGVTYTITEGSSETSGSHPIGSSGGISKGALAGIVIAAMLVLFAFALLLFLLIRRRRRRLARLSAGVGPQARENRDGNPDPFSLAAQNTTGHDEIFKRPFTPPPANDTSLGHPPSPSLYYSAEGYTDQGSLPPLLHHRRNTSSDMGSTGMLSWPDSNHARAGSTSDVPPPSYQAAVPLHLEDDHRIK
ncbi:hypothetical protein D9611_013047 [Ephemerocybe angulata]|uniref:Uncharacterized protein n=1 Tax=Ephemerocybe angulata TaxID=980116 RepID=A0A8H5AUK4_9AGAR|nr:hypothetical protein D9611_013047 [Tulosesus angulatus]